MNLKEKKISGETIYEGKVVKLYKDKVLCPNKNESYREVIRHPGGAAILCVTPDDKVLLIKQFRYPYDEVIYEIPAGKLEKGEDPYVAAMREFEEETGNKTSSLEHLIDIYPTCGYTDEIIYIYVAKDYVPSHTNFDPDEIIITEFVPFADVKKMTVDGTIKDAKTICAIGAYLMK